jgi:hypothetical protein
MHGLDWNQKLWNPLSAFFQTERTINSQNLGKLSSETRKVARVLLYLFGQLNAKEILRLIPSKFKTAYQAEMKQLRSLFKECLECNFDNLLRSQILLVSHSKTPETKALLDSRSAYSKETPNDLINRKIVEYLQTLDMPTQIARMTGVDQIPFVKREVEKMEIEQGEAQDLLMQLLTKKKIIANVEAELRRKSEAVWCRCAALKRISSDKKTKITLSWIGLAWEWTTRFPKARLEIGILNAPLFELHPFIPKTSYREEETGHSEFHIYILEQSFTYLARELDLSFRIIYHYYEKSFYPFDQLRRDLVFYVDYLKQLQSKGLDLKPLRPDRLIQGIYLPIQDEVAKKELIAKFNRLLQTIHFYLSYVDSLSFAKPVKQMLFSFVWETQLYSLTSLPHNFFLEFLSSIPPNLEQNSNDSFRELCEKEFPHLIPLAIALEASASLKDTQQKRLAAFFRLLSLGTLYRTTKSCSRILRLSLESPDFFESGLKMITPIQECPEANHFLKTCLHFFHCLPKKPEEELLDLFARLYDLKDARLSPQALSKTCSIYFDCFPKRTLPRNERNCIFQIVYRITDHLPKTPEEFLVDLIKQSLISSKDQLITHFEKIYQRATHFPIPLKIRLLIERELVTGIELIPSFSLLRLFEGLAGIAMPFEVKKEELFQLILDLIRHLFAKDSSLFNFFHATLHFLNSVSHLENTSQEAFEMLFNGIFVINLEERKAFDCSIVEGKRKPISFTRELEDLRKRYSISSNLWTRAILRASRNIPVTDYKNDLFINLNELSHWISLFESMTGCILPEKIVHYFLLYQFFYSQELLYEMQNFLWMKQEAEKRLDCFSLPTNLKNRKVRETISLFVQGTNHRPRDTSTRRLPAYLEEDFVSFHMLALSTLIHFVFEPYNYFSIADFIPEGIHSSKNDLIFSKTCQSKIDLLNLAHPDCPDSWIYSCRWFFAQNYFWFEMTLIQSLTTLDTVIFRVPLKISPEILRQEPHLFRLLKQMVIEMVQEKFADEEEETAVEETVWKRIPDDMAEIGTNFNAILPFFPHIKTLWQELKLNDETLREMIEKALFEFLQGIKKTLRKTVLQLTKNENRSDFEQEHLDYIHKTSLNLGKNQTLVNLDQFHSPIFYTQMLEMKDSLSFSSTLTVEKTCVLNVCFEKYKHPVVGQAIKCTMSVESLGLSQTVHYGLNTFLENFLINQEAFENLMCWQIAQLKSRYYFQVNLK